MYVVGHRFQRSLLLLWVLSTQFPNRMYVRTPTGYPMQSPVQPSGGPPTPTFSPHPQPSVGPPPYGTGGPSTPTDPGFYGTVPNMHHISGPVPSPLSRGVSLT